MGFAGFRDAEELVDPGALCFELQPAFHGHASPKTYCGQQDFIKGRSVAQSGHAKIDVVESS